MVMHEADRTDLERMCGGVIPDAALELYEQYQRAHMTCFSGRLPYTTVLEIAVHSGGVQQKPRKLDSQWSNVPVGTRVVVTELGNPRQVYDEGTFVRQLDGRHAGAIEVELDGNKGTFPYKESRCRLASDFYRSSGDNAPMAPAATEQPEATDRPQRPDRSSRPEPVIPRGPVKYDNQGSGPIGSSTPQDNFNWSKVAPGALVSVETEDGALQDGRLLRVPNPDGKHSGKLHVQIEGVHSGQQYAVVSSDSVVLIEEMEPVDA